MRMSTLTTTTSHFLLGLVPTHQTRTSDSHIGSTDANESEMSYHLPEELDACADAAINGEELSIRPAQQCSSY